jgi:hypothetical protein
MASMPCFQFLIFTLAISTSLLLMVIKILSGNGNPAAPPGG